MGLVQGQVTGTAFWGRVHLAGGKSSVRMGSDLPLLRCSPLGAQGEWALPGGLQAPPEHHLKETRRRPASQGRHWKELCRVFICAERPPWPPSAPTQMAPRGKAKGFLCPLLSRHLFTNEERLQGRANQDMVLFCLSSKLKELKLATLHLP